MLLEKNVKHYKELESTQKLAREKIEELENGTVILADRQTLGYGTKERKWYTGDGNNIAMTIVIKPNCTIKSLSTLTIDIAASIQRAIYTLYGYSLKIKEPNDLLLNNKKICGILTEATTIKENVKEIFIGIGFNVNENEFADEIVDIATSLYKETNHTYCREDIICKIIENIEIELEKRI